MVFQPQPATLHISSYVSFIPALVKAPAINFNGGQGDDRLVVEDEAAKG